MRNDHGRRGFTLIELVITLTILGIMAGVVALAWRRAPRVSSVRPITGRVLAARDSALRTGHPVTLWVADSSGSSVEATAFPDGRVVSDDSLMIDLLSGSVSTRRETP